MLFNSIEFTLFLPVVFIFYWLIASKGGTYQNIVLLSASVFFYAFADWRFLALIILNAVLNYYVGIWISNTREEKSKQYLLWLGVIFNLGILLCFKYYNFFYESFVSIFSPHELPDYSPLKLALPLGISFFTFQTLGYIIDVRNENIQPHKNLLEFITYVTYFPKVLAGPIERAQRFLPQIETKRTFDYALVTDGMRQILWGLFKKVVIADNCQVLTSHIFTNSETLPASSLVIGCFLYIIEVYTDFSGYSDMAIGSSKLFGIRLSNNFAYPFFAENIADFWRRWHISLSTWMMDYVYTPLSFLLRRLKKAGLIISILTTFIVIGLWHGPNWAYVLFGFLHGCYFIPTILFGGPRKSTTPTHAKLFPSILVFSNMLFTFTLVMLTASLMKVENVNQWSRIIAKLFSPSLFKIPSFEEMFPLNSLTDAYITIILVFAMFVAEWLHRDRQHVLQIESYKLPKVIRWGIYYGFILIIALFGGAQKEFIYLQF